MMICAFHSVAARSFAAAVMPAPKTGASGSLVTHGIDTKQMSENCEAERVDGSGIDGESPIIDIANCRASGVDRGYGRRKRIASRLTAGAGNRERLNNGDGGRATNPSPRAASRPSMKVAIAGWDLGSQTDHLRR